MEESTTVVWVASSPDSGRFTSADVSSEWEVLQDRFDRLRSRSQGYVELHRPGQEYPLISFSFRENYAVLHLFEDPERTLLLKGDGVVSENVDVDVPVMDELAT